MEPGLKLLANLLIISQGEVREALSLKDKYRNKKIPKKNGVRIISIPHPKLKKIQRRLLDYFLYRIPVHSSVVGFVPKSSSVINAELHNTETLRSVLRLDLKDAFPSIKTEHLRRILRGIFLREIERNSIRPLFPVKRVRWFRNIIKEWNIGQQLNLFHPTPPAILDKFLELILSLTTYQGKLPQGAPTSPYLLNLVISHSRLPEKILGLLWEKRILNYKIGILSEGEAIGSTALSIYADDLTISSSMPIAKSLIEELVALIEESGMFKVNRKKTLCFDTQKVAPLVTGLRLTKIPKSKEELKRILQKETKLSPKKIEKVLKRMTNKDGQWFVPKLSVPKKQIRRIRGLINRAITQKELEEKVRGYIAYLKSVYGDNLPKQISTPYSRFLESRAR